MPPYNEVGHGNRVELAQRLWSVDEYQRMVDAAILSKRDRVELVHGEIVHTTRYDRLVKMPLYAAAGVPEAWVVDADGRRIETYRTPSAGEYAEVNAFAREAVVSSMAFPDLAIPVAQIVG